MELASDDLQIDQGLTSCKSGVDRATAQTWLALRLLGLFSSLHWLLLLDP